MHAEEPLNGAGTGAGAPPGAGSGSQGPGTSPVPGWREAPASPLPWPAEPEAARTPGAGAPPTPPPPRPQDAWLPRRKRRRDRPRGGFVRFFSKQLLAFLALAILMIVVDFFAYAFFAVWESDNNYSEGSPASLVRAVDEGLAPAEGGLALSGEAADALAERGAWAILVAPDGTVAWEHGAPQDVPRAYTMNEVAMAVAYREVAGYPAFVWDRADGLLMVGFPKGLYWTMTFTYPASTMRNLPLYVLLILGIDFLILFAYLLHSRRRTLRATVPVASALEDLSVGRPVQLSLKGDLRDLGRQINETSAVIQRKDKAREQWIRGVSHDIRTPLTMILGYADGMANDPQNPEGVRAQAACVRTQAVKIKDLVLDLNSASQLSFDLQPLHTEKVPLARLLRTLVASHVNEGGGECGLSLSVDEDAANACVLGDERLLARAVENALSNARLHNEGGCNVDVRLSMGGDAPSGRRWACIEVADDGVGVSDGDLAKLEARLAAARVDGEVREETGGHGLGLVLVDRIARAHGGALALSHAPQGGFSVRIELPLA